MPNLKPATLEIMQELSRDAVAAVRYQVVNRVISFEQVRPALMWEMLSNFVQTESNAGVLKLVVRILAGLLKKYAQQSHELLEKIYERCKEIEDLYDVQSDCILIFIDEYIWLNNTRSRDLVFSWLQETNNLIDKNLSIIIRLRDALTVGEVQPTEPDKDAIRRRAWSLLNQRLQSTFSLIQERLKEHEVRKPWLDEEKEFLRGLYQVAESAARAYIMLLVLTGIITSRGRKSLTFLMILRSKGF